MRLATPHEILAEPATGWDAEPPRRSAARSPSSQALLGDPELPAPAAAALAAHGYRSRLRVPVHAAATVLGTLEAYSLEERPWTRFEIRRARIIANALGGALAHVHAEAPGGALAHVHAEAPGGAPVGRGGPAPAGQGGPALAGAAGA